MTLRPQRAAAWHAAGVQSGPRRPGDVPRWARCVEHRGTDVRRFTTTHFGEPGRRLLLVGGAGFDPRSLVIARLLASVAPEQVDGFYLREHRPNPEPALVARARDQEATLSTLVRALTVVDIPVFESDGAVAVGRHVIDAVQSVDLTPYTDLIIDFSALSIGSSFPLARYVLARVEQEPARAGNRAVNLHAMVTARPTTDDRIVPSPSQAVQAVHGFRGRLDLDETKYAARLWMPQLRFGHAPMLDRLYEDLQPDDVVPVLPFPSYDPRLGDRLVDHYAAEFDGRWAVDARSIVYADERNPLDFYRTVLRIHDGRNPVFASTGGNLLVLSPMGSKVLGLGAMMAAVERDLPVVYVESLSYTVDLAASESPYSDDDLVHVWLSGEAYPPAASAPVAPADLHP